MNSNFHLVFAVLSTLVVSCGGSVVAVDSEPVPSPDAGLGGSGGGDSGGTGGVGGSSETGGTGGGPAGCYTRSTDLSACQWLTSGFQQDITLASDLHYPGGLWVEGCKLYLLEQAGHNTSYGGNVRLLEFDLATKQQRVLVDNPEAPQAVAMGSDGLLYLATYEGGTPGDEGVVNVVDPSTCAENLVTKVEIAIQDMFASATGDLLVSGNTHTVGGKNVQLLRKGHYDAPEVIATGMDMCPGVAGDEKQSLYFVCNGLYQVLPNEPPAMIDASLGGEISMSVSENRIYFAQGGVLSRRELGAGPLGGTVLASNLGQPVAVRYSAGLNAVFYLQPGTKDALYRDGSLHVLTQVE